MKNRFEMILSNQEFYGYFAVGFFWETAVFHPLCRIFEACLWAKPKNPPLLSSEYELFFFAETSSMLFFRSLDSLILLKTGLALKTFVKANWRIFVSYSSHTLFFFCKVPDFLDVFIDLKRVLNIWRGRKNIGPSWIVKHWGAKTWWPISILHFVLPYEEKQKLKCPGKLGGDAKHCLSFNLMLWKSD